MEDIRRQNGQKNSSQNGESRRSQSSGKIQGFEGMNFEEQRGQYDKNDGHPPVIEQSGQSAPANMSE